MGLIVRPITDDGLVGYDQFGQLAVTKVEGDSQTINGLEIPVARRRKIAA